MVKIIIDIEFTNGEFNRGVVAHSIDFTPNEHWSLKIYKTQEDVFRRNPVLYWGVKNIKVIGYMEE